MLLDSLENQQASHQTLTRALHSVSVLGKHMEELRAVECDYHAPPGPSDSAAHTHTHTIILLLLLHHQLIHY